MCEWQEIKRKSSYFFFISDKIITDKSWSKFWIIGMVIVDAVKIERTVFKMNMFPVVFAEANRSFVNCFSTIKMEEKAMIFIANNKKIAWE